MSSTQKRGFRLPWSSDRDPQDPAQAVEHLANFLGRDDNGARSDVLDEASLQPPVDGRTPGDGTEVAGAAAMGSEADVLESVAEGRASVPEQEGQDGASAWPESDRHAAPTDHEDAAPTPAMPAPAPRPGRRENPLVAGLVRAMREAAETSRAQTLEELRVEAQAQVEAIRSGATDGAADVRKKAEDDIAEIREWAKAETARIRQESEQRIADRREAQTREQAEYEAGVETRVAQVEAAVASFEQEMARFFELLLAEEDPARLATLAERAPEPPILAELPELAPVPIATAALAPDDAAAAEAAAFEALGQSEEGPAEAPAGGAEPGVARILVTGLTSVAGISAFKGALSHVPGVTNVSVAAGEPGSFVFTVQHDGEANLRAAIPDLPGFGARITADDGATVTVAAREPAA